MPKPRRRWLLLLASASSVVAVGFTWAFLIYGPRWLHEQDLRRPPHPERQKHVEEKILGPEITAILRGPAQVEAVLLDVELGPQGEIRRERSARVVLPPALAERMQALLRTETTYAFALGSGGEMWVNACAPVYQARLVIGSGSERVTVDFCFGCYILHIGWDERRGESADFQSPEFARAFRALFRRDKIAARFE